MFLAYLWIDKIDNDPNDIYRYDNYGYNFYGKYTFSFDGRHIVNIEENNNYIENFYHKNIDSLTCIVGGNGSGKTTLLNNIKDLCVRDYTNILDSPHLAIFIENERNIEEFYCIYFNQNYSEEKIKEIRLSEKNMIDEKFNKHFHFEKYDYFIRFFKSDLAVIHYSNYINEDIDFKNSNNFGGYYDIQTKTLINSYSNELFEKLHYSFNPISIYQMEEYNNFFDFFLGINTEKFQNFINNNFDLTNEQDSQIMRVYATIEPIDYNYSEFRKSFIEKCSENSHIISYFDSLENFFKEKFDLTSKKINPLFVNKIEDMYIYHKWHYLHSIWLLLINAFPSVLNNQTTIENLKNIFGIIPISNFETVETLLDKFEKLFRPYYTNITNLNIDNLFINIKGFFNIIDKFLINEEFSNSFNNSLYLKIIEHNIQEEFKVLVDYYIKIISIPSFGRFCKFGWLRNLSSGEHSMLTLLSRLFKIFKNIKFKEKKLLVLIDEGEIGFHPYWQKKYISSLIEYFELLFKVLDKDNIKIQLIITTNNPIPLSDIQFNDVIYLSDHKVINNKKSTFGSNILDLYSDSFFIHDGLIGSFAQKKIANILENLKPDKFQPSKEYEFIINNIGDINIRNYVSLRYNEMKLKYKLVHGEKHD